MGTDISTVTKEILEATDIKTLDAGYLASVRRFRFYADQIISLREKTQSKEYSADLKVATRIMRDRDEEITGAITALAVTVLSATGSVEEMIKTVEGALHAAKRDIHAQALNDTGKDLEAEDPDMWARFLATKLYKPILTDIFDAIRTEAERRDVKLSIPSEFYIADDGEGSTLHQKVNEGDPPVAENGKSASAEQKDIDEHRKAYELVEKYIEDIDEHRKAYELVEEYIEDIRVQLAAAQAKFADSPSDEKSRAEGIIDHVKSLYNLDWAKEMLEAQGAKIVGEMLTRPVRHVMDAYTFYSNNEKLYCQYCVAELNANQTKQVVHNRIVKLETDLMVNSPAKASSGEAADTPSGKAAAGSQQLTQRKDASNAMTTTNGGQLTKSLAETAPAGGPKVTINNVEVVHHQGHLMLPIGLSIPDAIEVLKRRHAYMNEMATMIEVIDAFPWDGALAMQAVLAARYGWTPPPAATVSIEVGFNKTARIPWGKFTIPGLKCDIHTAVTFKDDLLAMKLEITVLNLHKAEILAVLEDVRRYCTENSIYRGQAITIKFHDEKGNKMMIPEVHFLDLSKIDPSKLIYSKEVREQINTNLFTPIERIHELKANGIPVKRGILLGGPFGTGKTLAAEAAAKLATDNGLTYIYVRNTQEVPDAISFSLRYQEPAAVVFAEDIDRTTDGERDIDVDEILNLVDGVETKHRNLILVFTTNEIDNIEPAMMRPGRLDAVIEVTPPDALAAAKLVELYGGDSLATDIDLLACGKALDGMIPAVISEVMRRAKLVQLSRTPKGQLVDGIGSDAIVESASTMRKQIDLLKPRVEEQSKAEEVLQDMGHLLRGEQPQVRRVA